MNLKLPKIKVPRALESNLPRYLSLLAGFFLFVAPFAIFTRVAVAISGENTEATLHSICYKLPLNWISTGFSNFFIVGIIAPVFIIGILVVAFLAGPLFCGRLCPVGALSELVSRAIPIPDKYRMRIKNPKTTVNLRYGFLVGFIVAGWLAGRSTACSYGVELGRYCSSSLLQFFSLGLFSNQWDPNFWNAGLILSLFMWLIIGGVMMIGGRGWCLFFCPLGAISGLAHKAGDKLGMYGIEFDSSKCRDCKNCDVNCPMWATDDHGNVEKALCIGCGECKNSCPFGSYRGVMRKWDDVKVHIGRLEG